MDDELFGDLLGPKPGSSVTSKAPALAPAPSAKGIHEPYSKITAMNGAEGEGTSAGAGLALGVTEANKMSSMTLTAEELSALVDKGVQSAMEGTFSKFVRSLRTVLEEMTRRISSQEATILELRAVVNDLRDTVQTQPSDLHVRFTSLDMAIKDVERGVQALRDRQELQEAQELVARMSSDTSRSKAQSSSTAGAAAAVSPAASPAPAAEAPAPAPSAPAPSPSPAPAPAGPAAPAASVVPPAASALAMPTPQQPQYGMPTVQQQAPQVPTHMPTGYPGGPSSMGPMPGAPPMPMQQQQQLAAEPQPQPQAPQQHLPPQAQPQPQQQPLPVPQYAYQPQPQAGALQPAGSMPAAAPQQDATLYGAPQQPPLQQTQQPYVPPHAQPGYPAPYGGMPTGMEPARAPAMPTFSMPPPGAPGGLAAGMQPQPHQPQMMSYPVPPGGIHAYPPPAAGASGPPGVSVSSMGMYGGRPTAQPPSYRASASQPSPSPSPGGGVGSASGGSRTVPLDRLISDISQMGFSRSDVMAAVSSLQQNNKQLDLNTIIDRLTRGV